MGNVLQLYMWVFLVVVAGAVSVCSRCKNEQTAAAHVVDAFFLCFRKGLTNYSEGC